MHPDNVYVVIVAAGTGSRFGSDVPKQFLPMGAECIPVLMHTIMAFRRAGIKDENMCIVLGPSAIEYWEELCKNKDFISPKVTAGGETRFHSVRNAMETIPGSREGRVLVHDGVRPLVSMKVIESVIEALDSSDCAVPVVPATNSLRHVCDDGGNESVNRAEYFEVQTPQGFRADVIKEAYKAPFSSKFTDDASVAESAGHSITMVAGDMNNIKVTTPKDLLLAEILLARGE